MSYRGRERRIWPEGREERRQGSSDLGCTPARPAGTRGVGGGGKGFGGGIVRE